MCAASIARKIMKVIDALIDILTRTRGHHVKKRYTFRRLAVATRFLEKHKAH